MRSSFHAHRLGPARNAVVSGSGAWRTPSPSDCRSDLLDLTVFEFYWSGTTEDRDGDLQAGADLVDFLDMAVERGERPVRNAHLLADLEGDRRLRALDAFLDLLQDALGL